MRGLVRPTAKSLHSSTLSVSEKCFTSPFELSEEEENDDEKAVVEVGG